LEPDGWDPTDTESSGHGKVRDHGDSDDHSGEPVENPSLPLDPSGENENTDNTEGEQGENDPKGGMSSMGRVEESSLGLGPRTVGER